MTNVGHASKWEVTAHRDTRTKRQKKVVCPSDAHMSESAKILMQAFMLGEGIVPLCNQEIDVNAALSTLPEHEARKIKRKFRKLWRKIAIGPKNEIYNPDYFTWYLGKNPMKPSNAEKRRRKMLVRNYFYGEKIKPIIDKFNATGDNA